MATDKIIKLQIEATLNTKQNRILDDATPGKTNKSFASSITNTLQSSSKQLDINNMLYDDGFTTKKKQSGLSAEEILNSDMAMSTKVSKIVHMTMLDALVTGAIALPSAIEFVTEVLVTVVGATLLALGIGMGLKSLWDKFVTGSNTTPTQTITQTTNNTTTINNSPSSKVNDNGGSGVGNGTDDGTTPKIPTIETPSSTDILTKWGISMEKYLGLVMPIDFVKKLLGISESPGIITSSTTGTFNSDFIEKTTTSETQDTTKTNNGLLSGYDPTKQTTPSSKMTDPNHTTNVSNNGLLSGYDPTKQTTPSSKMTDPNHTTNVSNNGSNSKIGTGVAPDLGGNGISKAADIERISKETSSKVTTAATTDMDTVKNKGISNITESTKALETAYASETTLVTTLNDGPYATLNNTLQTTVDKLKYIKTLQDSITGLQSQVSTAQTTVNQQAAVASAKSTYSGNSQPAYTINTKPDASNPTLTQSTMLTQRNGGAGQGTNQGTSSMNNPGSGTGYYSGSTWVDTGK